MPNGYCEALLETIDNVAEGNAPAKKMHVSGFLKMLFCCQNSSVSVLNAAAPDSGHTRTLTVKYSQRPTEDVVQDTDDCDVNRIPVEMEFNLPGWLYRQTSFFIADDEIRKFCDDASDSSAITPLMQKHYEKYVEHANILLKVINTALVTAQATQFGINTVTGLNTARTININQDQNQLILSEGVQRLLADLRDNENCDDVCLVGNGLMVDYFDFYGGDRQGLPTMFWDKATRTIWGANHFGVFAKGSVKFLGKNRYQGAWGGEKGGSIFMTVPFPVQEFNECADPEGCLNDLQLDMQLKYIDCPTTIDLNGVATPVGRGWQVILSKYFQLFTMPANLYAAGDELAGTNGTLRYVATNAATV